MKTLTPIRPRTWSRDLMTWPTESVLNRLFDWNGDRLEDWAPDMDLVEKPDAYIVKVEVPGIAPEDVHVTLEGRELTIKGERMKEEVADEENFRIRERSYGSFSRTFTFPLPVVEKDVDAGIVNGILNIKIKKAKEGKPTQIKVKLH